MDNRRRVEFFSTPTPIGGPPRGRFGLNALSRHPVRILMVVGGLILLVIVFFVALLTVDGGGSDDKKPKTAGTASGKSSSASPSPAKSGTGKPTSGQTPNAGPKPGSIAATVHTGGRLVMYKGTSYQSDKVVQIKTGTEVRANCHAEGSVAYYAGSSSRTWAQIDVEGKTGFVPAIFLETGGDVSRQIPACTR
ncbi:hypothetical protein ACIRL2_03675 [Embleya sp. NPDC127516]|jgi:hypothetical protein|uniref:hypothetical protein n=1 Tax=Embleya sp. NPDC127516 TaxID=3363990 RepID=UPI0037F2F293